MNFGLLVFDLFVVTLLKFLIFIELCLRVYSIAHEVVNVKRPY